MYSCEFSVGVCRPVLQILTLFQTKKYHFSQPCSDSASKKLSPLLRLEHQEKGFLKIHFEFGHFSFFLTHLELKR